LVFRLVIIATSAVASTTAARAQEPVPSPVEEEGEDLSEIEAALADDAAEVEEARPSRADAAKALLLPDISFVLDVAAAWFLPGEEEQLQTGGHDPTRNGFNLQQLELAIGKSVDPYFRFDGNLVFGQFGVELEEAYGTTLALPHALQARAGQFLTRFGRINASHPHAWDFVDQPFPIGRVFGGEGNRGLGVELSWLTPLPWYVELVGSATDARGEGTARSFFGADDLPMETPLDVQATAAVKQFFELNDDWSLLTGVSLATGPNGSGHDNRSDVWGVDLYLKWRPISYQSEQAVELQSEWLVRRRQVPRDLLTDVSGYAHAVWTFRKRWATGARWEYGSAADGTDPLDPDWTEARQRASLALTFWPTEFSRLRAQGSVDLPAWQDPIWAVFLAMELTVGAHGAHAF
jgi:hypothetical protein